MGYRLLPYRSAVYHGKPSSRPYFEGWYFKQVSGEHAFSIIPGVFRGVHESDDIAFIQIITPDMSRFIPYPYSEFRHNQGEFAVWIGKSFFSMDKVILDTAEMRAELFFSTHVSLKTNIFSPSVMGPFAYLPAMQCRHGVLSLTHRVNGVIFLDDKQINLHDAYGYIEKDWGQAFPDSWIWMQCNDHQTSLMCAVASIPYGAFQFMGLICVLLVGGKQYRFATYNGSRVLSVKKWGNDVTVMIRRMAYRLKISVYNNKLGSLKAPTKTGMNREIQESINAKYRIELDYKDKNIFSGNFENGGLEMLGVDTLIK